MKQRIVTMVIMSLSIMFIGSALLLYSLQAMIYETFNIIMPIVGGFLLTGILAVIIIKIQKYRKGNANEEEI